MIDGICLRIFPRNQNQPGMPANCNDCRYARPSMRPPASPSTRTPRSLRMLKSATRWDNNVPFDHNLSIPGVQEVLWVCQIWLRHRKGGNQPTWSEHLAQVLLPPRCAPTSRWRSATLGRRRFSKNFPTQPARGFPLKRARLTIVSHDFFLVTFVLVLIYFGMDTFRS